MNEWDVPLSPDFEVFIWKMIVKQDMQTTSAFEADRLLLGGRVALFQECHDNWGAAEAYAFLVDPTP